MQRLPLTKRVPDMGTLPNALIVGAAKAGTTSLYDYLRQHPDVYASPVKEPRFFAYAKKRPPMAGPGDEASNREAGAVYSLQEYRALFEDAGDESVRLEASPVYLYDNDAPRLIHEHCPDASLIVILRNPIERAYSHFMHLVRSGREPLREFEAALDAEDRRRAQGWEWSWHYRGMGYYGEQIARYLEVFDREQLHVFRFRALTVGPSEFAQRVYDVLDIDSDYAPNTGVQRRATGFPKWKWLHDFIGSPAHPLRRWSRYVLPEALRDRILTSVKNANLEKPPLPASARARLTQAYRDDIGRLEELLDRSFSDWLEAEA